MLKIALIHDDKNQLAEGELLLLSYLNAQKDFSAKAASWQDDEIRWKNFDVVIIRAAYNYHEALQGFAEWLVIVEALGVEIFNSKDVLIWSAHKSYLLDLQEEGVKIVDTLVVRQGQKYAHDPARFKSRQVIVKPAEGSSGHKVKKFINSETSDIEEYIRDLLGQADVLVQSFMEEIKDGEANLVFFDKKFSHAAVRKPSASDYRANLKYGGSEAVYLPSDLVVEQAQNILRKIGADLLYARVDGLVLGGEFILTELELIEPYLFFEMSKDSCANFTKALRSLV